MMTDTNPAAATTFKRTIFGREVAFTIRGDGRGVNYTYPNAYPYGYVGRMTRIEALRVIGVSLARMRHGTTGQGIGPADTRLGSYARKGGLYQ
jgi:hypothetical protein